VSHDKLGYCIIKYRLIFRTKVTDGTGMCNLVIKVSTTMIIVSVYARCSMRVCKDNRRVKPLTTQFDTYRRVYVMPTNERVARRDLQSALGTKEFSEE
jgi:hypothetical protein